MKNLIAVFLIIFFANKANSKIVYLNNNITESNISEDLYIIWADAYAASSMGDTIYIVGSNISHGNITINKPLTIIGPGYFLDENIETQVNKNGAEFGNITLASGSDNSSISGLKLLTGRVINIKSGVNNIAIKNSNIFRFTIGDAGGGISDNIQIMKCYFSNSSNGIDFFTSSIVTNLSFYNNIFNCPISIPNGSSGIFSHNLLLSNTFSLGSSSSFEIVNNIYLNDDDNGLTIQALPDAAVHHNISKSAVFGSENNNIIAVESLLFIGASNASTDGQYQLAVNSPAKGAGYNGTDIGPFGGPIPYRLSGLPNLPNIYELSTGGLVSGDKLPVRIKIKQ